MLKKLKENSKDDIGLFHEIGSTFEDDESEEYKFKIINKIQEHTKKGRIIIFKNFPKFFSHFMNYLI